MSLETSIANFDVTPFLRVGSPRRSSWLSGVEGALAFFYEAPSGRVFLIRTQAPWVIRQIQLAFRTTIDGQLGDLTRRAIAAGLRASGMTAIADNEPAGARLLGPALTVALFGGRGRVQFPARVEWPDTSRALLASGHSTYLAAFDLATGRDVPVETITTAPAAPAAPAPPAPVLQPPAPAPQAPPTATSPSRETARPAPPTDPAAPVSHFLETRPPAPPSTPAAPSPAQPVVPAGERPAQPAPPGYAYIPIPGGPTVLVPVAQVSSLTPGQPAPPAPEGHQWTVSLEGQVVLVSLAAPNAAPQGACPLAFVGDDKGCKPTEPGQLPTFYGASPPMPADPADMAPKAKGKGLASKDPSLSEAQRAKAKELEAVLWAHPETTRGESIRTGLLATAIVVTTGGVSALAGHALGKESRDVR